MQPVNAVNVCQVSAALPKPTTLAVVQFWQQHQLQLGIAANVQHSQAQILLCRMPLGYPL